MHGVVFIYRVDMMFDKYREKGMLAEELLWLASVIEECDGGRAHINTHKNGKKCRIFSQNGKIRESWKKKREKQILAKKERSL